MIKLAPSISFYENFKIRKHGLGGPKDQERRWTWSDDHIVSVHWPTPDYFPATLQIFGLYLYQSRGGLFYMLPKTLSVRIHILIN